MDEALAWSASILGPVDVLSDHSKQHDDHESATCRLRRPDGFCYLKVHENRSHWENEVHAYEQWAAAFGSFAPRLIAVRTEEPLALIVSELPGRIVEDLPLSPSRERLIWRRAGLALVPLHRMGMGGFFGPCRRDGSNAGGFVGDARQYVSRNFDRLMERALQAGYLDQEELATVRAAYALIPAFEGEPPTPCHRDYCTANWLINEDEEWNGIIDFEFACWDVRVADFSRDPSWAWFRRPDLVDAFFEGYGFSPTPAQERQLLVARAEYALGAIVWGHDNTFYGFEQEGRESLAHLASLLR